MRRIHHKLIDSTSAEARRLVAQHPGETLLVSAEAQSAGRGRHGRTWHSPPGGAWFTLAVTPDPAVTPERFGLVPLLAGLAVLKTLQDELPPSPADRLTIKWPNDVLLDGRKVAGILCENVMEPGPATLLIGIGVNLNLPLATLPQHPRHPATSFLLATGATLDVSHFIDQCVRRLQQQLASIESHASRLATIRNIQSLLAWRDTVVQLTRGDETISGILSGLDEQGRLRLACTNGTTVFFDGGEVSVMPHQPATATPTHHR